MFIDRKFKEIGLGQELNKDWAKNVFREIELYLGKPIDIISQEYWKYKQGEDKEKQKQVAKAQNSQEILDYYKTTDLYLYELLYWEALKNKHTEFKKICLFSKKYRLNSLLDFGGGVGGLSIFMARQGIRCDYLDVRGKTFDFARWRFSRRNLNIRLYLDSIDLPKATYDGVITYDVLEHLFDVREAIEKIAKTLRKNGYFVTRSSFAAHNDGVHLPKNRKFQDMKIFNAMMRECHFSFIGQLKPDRLSYFLKKLSSKNLVLGIRIVKRLKYGGNFIIYQKR